VNKPEKVIPEAETLPAVVHATPMTMLDRAVASGASIEVLEKLMGLQERFEANQARKAFDAAIADAKSQIPPIIRNATGHNAKRYADFAAIAAVIDPIIGQHGLNYRFRTVQTDKIAVTCILSHKAGHSEETTLCGPADATGNKNAIQAIGSTLTYLQRYSLVQALGLAAAHDDDGKSGARRHSTAPEDVYQQPEYDISGQPIDNIPIVEGQQLPKKDSKEAYRNLQAELWAHKDIEELKTWGKAVAARVAALPSDWAAIFRGQYREHLAHLQSVTTT
jgi:ERF superfamily